VAKNKKKIPFKPKGTLFTYEEWTPAAGKYPHFVKELSLQERVNLIRETSSPEQFPARLSKIASQYPSMSLGSMVGFANNGASDDVVAAAARMEALMAPQPAATTNMVDVGSAGYDYLTALNKDEKTASPKDYEDAKWFAGLKRFTRYASTTAFTPFQLAINTARQADAAYNVWADKDAVNKGNVQAGEKALDFSQIVKDTYLYQNLVEGKDLGEGFFWGGEALEETERIAHQIATVNGATYTPGRAIESMLGIDNTDRGYGIISGILDGIMGLKLDPVVVTGQLNRAREAAQNAAKAREGSEIGANLSAIIDESDFALREEATNLARQRTKDAREKLKQSKEDYQETAKQVLADINERFTRYPSAVYFGDSSGVRIQRLWKTSGIERVYDVKNRLLEQLDDVKNGVPLRLGETGGVLKGTKAENFLNQKIKEVDAEIDTTLLTIYENLDPEVAGIIGAARSAATSAAEELKASLNPAGRKDEIERYVLENRMGFLQGVDGWRLEAEKAKQWLAGGEADEFLQTLANATSPYEIDKLTRFKFGPELAAQLADTKNIDEVEAILLPKIGLEVLPNAKRGVVGRYVAQPLSNLALRMAPKTVATEKVRRVINSALDYKPTGRPVHLQDTASLVEETRRWMVTARYNEDEVAAVWDRIAKSDPHNYQERQGIILSMLDRTAAKYADDLKLSPRMRSNLQRLVTAYNSELSGLRQYSSRVADNFGDKVIVHGEEIDLTDTPLSIAQFASEIVLPDVYKVRELTGNIAKIARYVDNKIGENVDIAERAAFAGSRAIRSASDGFLRSVLIVGRTAFVIRNIMEMQGRSFLAGGANLLTNPVAMTTMLIGNKSKSGKLAELARAKDPYTVDINGLRFVDQGDSGAFDQEIIDSYFRFMTERGFSFDGRSSRGVASSGEFKLIRLSERGVNADEFADALAHRLLLHRADPIKRALASGTIPRGYQRLVSSGKMTFEEAFIQAVRDGAFANQIDIMRKSSEPLRRLLESPEGMRVLFFTGKNSYMNELKNDTLGITEWMKFIADGAITSTKNFKSGPKTKTVFEMSQDFVRNSRDLRKIISDELVEGNEAFVRAQQIELPYVEKTFMDKNLYNKFAEAFFRVSGRAEVRAVLGPEYRVAYWEAVAELAPLMNKSTAQKFLDGAVDIKKTKVAEELEDGTIVYQAWTKKNPAFNDIVQAAKNGDGPLTAKQIDEYANTAASKKLGSLYYDALQKRNFIYAAQLVIPFANAWANTLDKWATLSRNPNRLASRVLPAIKAFSTAQSQESSAIYDVLGTRHDPTQGFIYENLYGEKVFTVPMTGYLRTMFGLFGDPKAADITVPVQSLNLLLQGADLPGTDLGITPGVGTLWNVAYSSLPIKLKESVPPVVADIIAPYGDKAGNPIGAVLPAWAQKVVGGIFQTEDSLKFVKPIMANMVSTNPKFMSLYDGTPLTVEQRSLLQEELVTVAITQSRQQYALQGLIQSVSPGTPLYEYYASNKNGDSLFQWQLSKALNQIIDVHEGNYDMAYNEYATMFGTQAIMATVSVNKDLVFATDRAWKFATENPETFKAYSDVLPYFFAGTDFSSAYRTAMIRRGQGGKLTPNEVLEEADKLTMSAVKGQLAIYATRNGLGADWIDSKMSAYKMDTFQGYEPEVSLSVNRLAQKIVKVESALRRPELAQTPAGSAAVKYVEARNQALKESALRYPDRKNPSLSGVDNADLRMRLEQLGSQLSVNNPDFANLHQRVFLQELRKG
jgi:hypothetical protein